MLAQGRCAALSAEIEALTARDVTPGSAEMARLEELTVRLADCLDRLERESAPAPKRRA